MESGGFFNAEQLSDGSYDMNYVAEQFAQYFALFVGNGIFVDNVNNLQASAAGNMNVKFNKGAAFWDGYWYINSEDLVKTVDLNLDASARIDSFVVRFDIAGRKNSIEYKKGDMTVQRADGIYELQLCTVRVDAGAISITDSNITDMRTDENVCGFVKGLLEVVKTDDLFKQFSDMFNTWFENIRGVLDGDTAGNIIGMIGSLDDLQTTNKDNIVAAVNEVDSNFKNATKFRVNYPDSSIESAVGALIDDYFDGYGGSIYGMIIPSAGYYVIQGFVETTGKFTGILQLINAPIVTYSVYRLAGADAVLKKLGSVGTALAEHVLSPYTFSNNDDIEIKGTLADKTGTTNYSATASLDATNSRLRMKIPSLGRYGTGNYLYAAYSTIRTLIGLTAAKIVTGNTILGLDGTGGNKHLVKLGTTSGTDITTFNLSAYYGYSSFTKDNFLFVPSSASQRVAEGRWGGSTGVSVTAEYILNLTYSSPTLSVTSYSTAKAGGGYGELKGNVPVPLTVYLVY